MTNRKKLILEIMYEQKKPYCDTSYITVAKMADMLYEDRSEIRKDFKELNEEGYIESYKNMSIHKLNEKFFEFFT